MVPPELIAHGDEVELVFQELDSQVVLHLGLGQQQALALDADVVAIGPLHQSADLGGRRESKEAETSCPRFRSRKPRRRRAAAPPGNPDRACGSRECRYWPGWS